MHQFLYYANGIKMKTELLVNNNPNNKKLVPKKNLGISDCNLLCLYRKALI